MLKIERPVLIIYFLFYLSYFFYLILHPRPMSKLDICGQMFVMFCMLDLSVYLGHSWKTQLSSEMAALECLFYCFKGHWAKSTCAK